MVKQTSALLFVYYFYSQKLEIGGNWLCGLKYIHITCEVFIFGHVFTLEMGAIYILGLFFMHKLKNSSKFGVDLAGLCFFLMICMKFAQ